jgi:integrase
MSRKWRAERFSKAGGTYWFVTAGRNAGRIRIALKYVTAEQAERARDRIQLEEDRGTIARVLEQHAYDPEAVVELLAGDGPADLGELPAPATDHGRKPLRAYVADVYSKARAASHPRSWVGERGHLDRILADLGDTRLRDLDPRAFVRWVRDVRVRRQAFRPDAAGDDGLVPASGSYQRLLRAALQAVLSYAYVEGHLDTHVRLGEVRLAGSTRRAREPVQPLSLDEVRALLLAAKTPLRRAMWAVGVGQGLRPGELVRVRWEDVDWDASLLTVRGTKTEESAAVIPMTPIGREGLLEHWEAEGKPRAGLVFVRKLASEDGKGSSYRRALKTDAEAAKIDRKVHPYLLRHSFATLAWSLGLDKDVARRIMRHTDLGMLDKVYTRPRPADLVERAAAFTWRPRV